MHKHAPSGLCNRRCVLASAAGIAFTGLWSSAHASDQRPIKLIVPFGAGSSVDILARLTSERIAHHLGVPIIIDNRSGAGGGVGAASAAQAAPDGTNLFFGTAGTQGINPALYKKLAYDPVKDFEPVVAISSSSNVMVVNPKLGIKSLWISSRPWHRFAMKHSRAMASGNFLKNGGLTSLRALNMPLTQHRKSGDVSSMPMPS